MLVFDDDLGGLGTMSDGYADVKNLVGVGRDNLDFAGLCKFRYQRLVLRTDIAKNLQKFIGVAEENTRRNGSVYAFLSVGVGHHDAFCVFYNVSAAFDQYGIG